MNYSVFDNNQLLETSDFKKINIKSKYDGHNRRVRVSDSNKFDYSLYSQCGTLLYRETANGGINYIYLGKKLVSKVGQTDVPNSNNQHFRPFGSSIEGETNNVGYTGHKFDTDIGLSYMQARYYDPVIGRFYSNDPVDAGVFIRTGNVHGFNRYAYVSNNPYKYTDPDGMKLKFTGSPSQTYVMRSSYNKAKHSTIGNFMKGMSLEGSKNTHTVAASPGAMPKFFVNGFKENAENGVGAGSTTILDPNDEPLTTNKDGSQVINSKEAVMAHEVLGHASDADNGKMMGETNDLTGETLDEANAINGPEKEYKEVYNEKERDCHSNC